MKRSGSKLISKAGSMRNINKAGFKFQVVLKFESVEKVLSANEVCLVWERGGRSWSTAPVSVDRTSREAKFGNMSIAHEITLFKRKKEVAPFDEKVFRLSLRQNSDTGKVLGRIALNISDYCSMTSTSKRVGASLSNNSRVVMAVETVFLREAKARKQGSKGSVGSTIDDDQSLASIDDANLADIGDLPEFDDLAVDDISPPAPPSQTPVPVPLSTPAPAPLSSSTPARPQLTPSTQTNRRMPSNPPVVSSASSADHDTLPPTVPLSRRTSSAHSPVREPIRPTPMKDDIPVSRQTSVDDPRGPPLSSAGSAAKSGGSGSAVASAFRLGRQRKPQDMSSDAGNGMDEALATSKADLEKLRKENRRLQRRNNDLQTRVADLEGQLDDYQDAENGQLVDELSAENKSLKAYIEELEVKLRREPIYSDVVRDLRETKMALAIQTLERDELFQEVRRLRK